MTFVRSARRIGLALAVLGCGFAGAVQAQQAEPEPSPAALAIAKEILDMKDGGRVFAPIVPGVIEQVRLLFVQNNPMLTKDVNEVAAGLRNEFAARNQELLNIAYRTYALRFTEAELKEVVAFYRTPVGKKVITEEPSILESAMSRAQQWSIELSEQVITRLRTEMKKRGHDA